MSEFPRFQESVQTLEAFRGIGRMTAMQLICEIGDFRRFERPTALMAYLAELPPFLPILIYDIPNNLGDFMRID